MLWAGLVRRSRAESEMAEELRFHMESRAADLEREGLAAADAKRRARLEFGSVEGYKEVCREARGFRFFDELRADLRYAFRTLRHSPGFTAMTVLSLALGIGVNLLVFSSLYYVVLNPFPYPALDRMVTVSGTRAKSPSERSPSAAADFLDWKQASRSFESLAAYQDWDVNLTGVSHPDHIQSARASAEFFDVLGMHALRGRTFGAAECEPGRDAVVVVSYGFWQTRLAARPDAVGETLSLGGLKHTVIGIMPDEFNLPLASELWVPLALTPEEKAERGVPSLQVIGRLKPGVSAAQAGADVGAIARDLERRYPRTNEERRVLVSSFREVMKNESPRFLLVLAGAACFVLLLACTNVGGLQVARTMGRQREFGLRTALGAGTFRILRQLLTESLLVGVAGGAVGLALASWDLNLIRSNLPPMVFRFVPGLRDMRINGETVALGIVLAIAASLLCCLPAIFQVLHQGRQADVAGALREGGRTTGASPSRSRVRTALVTAGVALAFLLLVGAGLMAGTFQRMLTVPLGYDPHHVLAGEIALYGSEYRKPSRIAGFYETVLRNAGRLPHVQAAAAVGGLGPTVSVSIEGRPQPRPEEPKPDLSSTTPEYLRAMRILLLQGRWISERDGPEAPPVVVLSASVVRHYWPASDPLGQRVRLGGADSPWLTVVGVSGDVHDWFFGDALPAAYVSYRQFPQASMRILLRTPEDSPGLAAALGREVREVDREQPLYNVQTLEQQMRDAMSGVRNASQLMISYAVIALLLAVTGIYSISAFFVVERTREIGVRMSLGATPRGILKMVLAQSCSMSGIGLLVGLPLAVLLTLGMSRVLYNVVPVRPMMFVGVTALLGALSVLAGYIPARRAARLEPMAALRHE
jgi:putative ABC transport system permease protein